MKGRFERAREALISFMEDWVDIQAAQIEREFFYGTKKPKEFSRSFYADEVRKQGVGE